MSVDKNDPRAKMYAETREILTAAITFSDAERLALAVARRDALVLARDKQADAAASAATTLGQMKRASERVRQLYAEEIQAVEEEINQLKQLPSNE